MEKTSEPDAECSGSLRCLLLLRRTLARLPAEAGGIALNLAGLGSWLSAFCELHPWAEPLYDTGSAIVVSLACTILFGMALQALLHNAHLRGELQKPKQCGSYGGLLMSLTLCCSYVRFLPHGGDAALVLVHVAAVLQVLMLAWYLFWTAKIRSPPVPYWFPATVGVGMAGIAGSAVGMASWLQQLFFWLSAALCAVEWPWITLRCAYSDRIAPAPSIFVHGAPVSLVSLSFMQVIVKPLDAPTEAALAAGHFFFVATTGAAITTLAFAARRAEILRRFIMPHKMGYVHQEWSGLTFPLVATSTYALLYAEQIVPTYGNETATTAARVWATALGIFTLSLVVLIDVFYFAVGLPRWFCVGLPPVPAPPALTADSLARTGEKACCRCWPPLGGGQAVHEARATGCSPLPEGRASPAFIHRNGSMYGVVHVHATKAATAEYIASTPETQAAVDAAAATGGEMHAV